MTRMRSVPALYEMEPIGVDGQLEANGRVYFFCPDRDCRDAFNRTHAELKPLGFGWDTDAIDKTVCDYCGDSLEVASEDDLERARR